MTAPIIDFHAHLIPPRLVEELAARGQDYGVHVSGPGEAPNIRLEGSSWTKPMPLPLMRIEERIATLDRQGIDRQGMVPWIDFSGYTMPAELGIRFSEIAERDDRRSGGGASGAALRRGDGADAGSAGGGAGAQARGSRARVPLGAGCDLFRRPAIPRRSGARPLLARGGRAAEEMKVLVYFHPYDEQPPNGTRDYFLHNIVNYPLQTAIAIPRMIFGGVFSRFPRMSVRFPHGGGYLPYQFGRIRCAAAVRPEPKAQGLCGRSAGGAQELLFRYHLAQRGGAPFPCRDGGAGPPADGLELSVRHERSRSGGERACVDRARVAGIGAGRAGAEADRKTGGGEERRVSGSAQAARLHHVVAGEGPWVLRREDRGRWPRIGRTRRCCWRAGRAKARFMAAGA